MNKIWMQIFILSVIYREQTKWQNNLGLDYIDYSLVVTEAREKSGLRKCRNNYIFKTTVE